VFAADRTSCSSGSGARLCLEDTLDQLLVIEQSIGRAHPRFPEVIYFLSQNTGPQ
jgi:hypothetical protein